MNESTFYVLRAVLVEAEKGKMKDISRQRYMSYLERNISRLEELRRQVVETCCNTRLYTLKFH